MNRELLAVSVWFIFGIYAWGTVVAQVRHDFPDQIRGGYGLAAFAFVTGLAGAIVAALMSDLNKFGWKLK